MKYFVTRISSNGEKIHFYSIKEKGNTDFYEYDYFLLCLGDVISSKNRIFKMEFLGERVLRIDYVSGYDKNYTLKSATFYFGEDIPLNSSFFLRLKNLERMYQNTKSESREKIEAILSESEDKRTKIEACQKVLKNYLLAGFIIDDNTGLETAKLFSFMMSERYDILKDLKLPLPLKTRIKLRIMTVYNLFRRTSFCPYRERQKKYKASINFEWNTYVWESFINSYNQKHDFFLENKESNPVLLENKQDPFIRFVLSDIDYIKNMGQASYVSELNYLEKLVKRYIESKRDELRGQSSLDIEEFSSELTDFELKLFSKNKKFGLKRSDKTLIREEMIKERLKFIGIADDNDFKDDYLSLTKKIIQKIISYPYEGCEASLTELYKIAAEYVKDQKEQKSELRLYTTEGEYLKRLVALEIDIDKKIVRCSRAESLAQDLETLEVSLENARTVIKSNSKDNKRYNNNPTQ